MSASALFDRSQNASPAVQAPRLTKLEVHGFKSFATRTTFAFEPGITAIVGPNGSGKSNVADAVRWVLGEQGQSALRAKRTEDVIFAGGQGKAPAGLAEATLTFDNSGRWLPIDFTEVTVTRRAFRSGENHYLINGRRVRLKDVAQLTASLGQSHVVVGQGLVDAALSQKAAERRALFEHAADLAGLRLKVAEAERNLAEAEANSQRLEDLRSELEPRLRALERAAKQAREWQGLHDRLQALQRTHFGRLLAAATANEQAATAALAEQARALSDSRADLERREHEAAILDRDAERARVALADHDAARLAVAERLRAAEHARDLAAERAAALGRRADDMTDTRQSLEVRARSVADDLSTIRAEMLAIEEALGAVAAEIAAHEEAQRDRRRHRQACDRQVIELAAMRTELEGKQAAAGRRRLLLEQRAEAIRDERSRLRVSDTTSRDRLERLLAELAEAEAAEGVATATLQQVDERLAELGASGGDIAGRLAAVVAQIAECERMLGLASTRLDALTKLHDSGAGLHAGVREVLAASGRGDLTGVRGTVAEQIESAPELETAIEVALGGHLQDLVVEHWADAEAAIAHLKRSRAGRATFQPLDTVRGGRGRDRRIEQALSLTGSRGVAADLVRSAPELRQVVAALLGRTLVVDDLPSARQSLPHLPLGWSAVTLAGEIARSGGSVTGGVATRESGLLAREREMRELPAEIRRLREELDSHSRERAEATRIADDLERQRREAAAERAALVAAGQERARLRDRLSAWVAELRTELAQRDERGRQLDQEEAAIASELASLAADDTDLLESLAATAEREAMLTADRERDAQANAVAEQHAAELNQSQTRLSERLRGEQRRCVDLENQERALAAELQLRGERAEALERERATLAAQQARLAAEVEGLQTQQTELTDARFPLHGNVRRLEAARTRSAQAVAIARDTVLTREREHGARELALERASHEVADIRRQLSQELDLDDASDPLANQAPDQYGDDDAGREREIGRLRERLRRVGFVGQDVVADYEREAAHQAFVRQQLADVQGAAASLRTLLADLQLTMRSRFDETFSRVSAVFSEVFAVLFGGGTARLVLTGGEPTDDGGRAEPGVEIVAQPPGKRLQSLALLSGGERALTAVALLFAILRVNPAPFCLLDEVDAALDEANVVRFREQLGELAAKTQVIIVTHNRGTIETADTLYGVSMGVDGVSRVLSLRMSAAD